MITLLVLLAVIALVLTIASAMSPPRVPLWPAVFVLCVIELLRETGAIDVKPATDVYVLHQGGATQTRAFLLADQLRDAGLDVILHAGDASLKSQMKKADASGAEYAVIVGEEEAARDAAVVKALRAGASEAFAEQRIVPLDRIADALAEALSSNDNQ